MRSLRKIRRYRGVRKLAGLAGLGCLMIAAARGCMLAEEKTPEAPPSREIAVYNDETGGVERMELEEYLVGVVGAEMPASFPLEALKAQAVAARTYTVRRLKGKGCGRGGADICTDSGCCQAYSSREKLEKKFGEGGRRYMDKLREAVYSTAGEIAVYDGKPIEALYHSSAGGHTEDSQNVFSAALPYLIGVDSPGEEDGKKYSGVKEMTAGEFIKAVNGRWPRAKLRGNRLKSQVKVTSRYDSGRAERVKLGGVTVSGRDLRKLLDLNSASFTIEIGRSVIIRTRGYGHGVGMSQYGARAMALEGRDYREILCHYYTGIDIVKEE